MTLQDLGSIGEFVAAIATILTLVYLALQIRSNTKAVRASTFQGVTSGWQLLLQFSVDPDVAGLVDRATEQPEHLEATEIRRLFFLSRAMFRLCENDYYQFRSGTFDADAWNGYKESIVEEIVGPPGLRAMWSIQRHLFSSGFAEFMDEQAAVSRTRAEQRVPDGLDELWQANLKKEGAV